MLGERIQRARNAKNLSLRDLGDLVGISHASISKYERGETHPDSTVLLKIAKALGVKTEFFYRETEFILENIEYRKREISRIELLSIESKVLNLVEKRFELENLFVHDLFPVFEVPKDIFNKDEIIRDLKDIDQYADKLRRSWKIGFDSISDLSSLLEEHGIKVFMINESVDNKFDGLAALVNTQHIVAVSKEWSGDRQRFTLAHELAHLILEGHLSNDLDEEKACNRFAGAFLLPTVAIKKALGEKRKRIEVPELGLIKSEYGVSMQSTIMRASQTGIIDNKCAGSLWGKFKKNKWMKIEPGDPYPPEKVYAYKHMVLKALAKEYISESKAAEFLEMSVKKFHKYRMENKV